MIKYFLFAFLFSSCNNYSKDRKVPYSDIYLCLKNTDTVELIYKSSVHVISKIESKSIKGNLVLDVYVNRFSNFEAITNHRISVKGISYLIFDSIYVLKSNIEKCQSRDTIPEEFKHFKQFKH